MRIERETQIDFSLFVLGYLAGGETTLCLQANCRCFMSLKEKKADSSVELMQECILTAEAIGTEKTKQILQEERKQGTKKESKFRQVILKSCSKAFGVSVEEIMSGRSKGDRTDALRCCYVITKYILSYNYKQIANLFGGKDESLPKKYIKEFNLMSRESRVPAHKDFFKKYDEAYEAVCAHFNLNPKTVS